MLAFQFLPFRTWLGPRPLLRSGHQRPCGREDQQSMEKGALTRAGGMKPCRCNTQYKILCPCRVLHVLLTLNIHPSIRSSYFQIRKSINRYLRSSPASGVVEMGAKLLITYTLAGPRDRAPHARAQANTHS